MNVCRLSQADLPALLDLYRHLHATDDPLPSPGRVDEIWQEIIDNDRIRYFGAFVADALVASCTIAIVPNLTRGCRPYGVIENVVTHVACRKQGHARALLHTALAFGWENGCYKIMLMTGRKDKETLDFYRSSGFDPNGKQAFVAKAAPSMHLDAFLKVHDGNVQKPVCSQ